MRYPFITHPKNTFCSIIILFQFTLLQAQDTSQQVIAGRANGRQQLEKPYVILISADGFRADFAEKYDAIHLQKLGKQGVRASYMLPSFPSVTFPNHYSIITGLYPAHHGLVDNSFYDSARDTIYSMANKKQVADAYWYGGTPLWVLAEKQNMLSASFYWVASESNIQDKKPSYYYIYNEKINIDARIQAVKNWLQLPAIKRPHFITFYFPEVDHAAHIYGPDSKEAAAAVHFVDEAVGRLQAMTDSIALPVNFIFVSDHGMTKVDNVNTLKLPEAVDKNKFYVPTGDALVQLYAKDKKDVLPTYIALQKEAKDYDVYLAEDMPKKWHYSRSDDHYNRIGDIILVPVLPKVFNLGTHATSLGKHGFDPAVADMHAIFYAWGPAFKKNMQISGFENVHVYPLIATILGLTYSKDMIDGKAEVLLPVLRNKRL
jgi:predicted AlkP superfamily pyrophosphatase or phosphodiesterase